MQSPSIVASGIIACRYVRIYGQFLGVFSTPKASEYCPVFLSLGPILGPNPASLPDGADKKRPPRVVTNGDPSHRLSGGTRGTEFRQPLSQPSHHLGVPSGTRVASLYS
jgi:hypothetical protein